MKPWWIYLDDERTPPSKPPLPWLADEPVLCRSYAEFVETIQERGAPEFVDFDWYLGHGETGADCAEFLIEWFKEHPEQLTAEFYWNIHTSDLSKIPEIARPLGDFLDAHQPKE